MLQTVLAVIGFVLFSTGILGMASGIMDDFYGIDFDRMLLGHAILDSNLRFFGGLSIGLGLLLFRIIPIIEKQQFILRLVSVMIFLGGLGRVVSMAFAGNPSGLFVLFTLLELLFPLLVLWQNGIVKSHTD